MAGLACRSPPHQPVVRRKVERGALKSWVLQNFDSYWRPLLHRSRLDRPRRLPPALYLGHRRRRGL